MLVKEASVRVTEVVSYMRILTLTQKFSKSMQRKMKCRDKTAGSKKNVRLNK